MYSLSRSDAQAALLGGLFLGGGGGGSLEKGLETMETAFSLGDIHVAELEELSGDETIVTASMVGSPASKEGAVSRDQVLKGFDLFRKISGSTVSGIISNENGGHSSSNGWILAAATGLPIVDAPCNGRAHPTGVMGSMGLDGDPSYRSVQCAAGGCGERTVELAVSGEMNRCAVLVRQAAVQAGGLVAVYRNPVKAGYLADNAAPGALAQSIAIGKIFQGRENRDTLLDGLWEETGAVVLASGPVVASELIIQGGFDHGSLTVEDGAGLFRTGFWNEFMMVDGPGGRLATFPDLIAFLDKESGRVVTSAEMAEGREVDLLKVPAERLILGAGMRNRSQFELVEQVLDSPILSHLSGRGLI